MTDSRSHLPAVAARDFPLLHRSTAREIEAPPAPSEASSHRSPRVIADEMLRGVQSRLPGRIRDLKIRIDNDQFVLSGVASSYHVKQIAQHVAMNALDAAMLGRLINEIEVRSVR